MKVNVETEVGCIVTEIENCESYHLDNRCNKVVAADYVNGYGGIVLLQFGDDFEFVENHRNKNLARIHAKQIKAAICKVEGVSANA